jgi:metal-responsive CopG/Arc/MetJ family transcriptional regulator
VKTAISIPDAVFEEAEVLARRLRVSRSGLYTSAIQSYLQRFDDREVTRRLDAIYARESSRVDPALDALQWGSLVDEGW